MRARLLALALLPTVVHAAPEDPTLAKIRKAVEAARKASPVPGLSLAIVKDGKLILAEGFGYADVARRKRATADTVYEIGSVTKSFTALLATQAQAEGRLSLKDRPTKYLPAFRLHDADASGKITLEDMLSHRSGLPRTDLVWYASDFSRDDLMRVAAEAEPTAPLGKAWQYQNLMFLFMGMIEEKAYGEPYEALLGERYFAPLGMAHSDSTYAATKAQPLLATGYSGEGRALPLKQVDRIAPAGTISSTARDMARYVTMLLRGGEFEGRRLFAKEAVEETRKPRIAMPGGSYGLGWMLADDDGVKRVYHGGNIDGFSAMVTLIPERGIGVVALTNGNAAALPTVATNLALEALMPKKAAPGGAFVEATADELGAYRLAAPPVDLAFTREGKTVFLNQNGQKLALDLVGPKRYTLQKAVYVTFGEKDKDGKPTAKLEQAGMTFTLTRPAPYVAPITAEALLAQEVAAMGGADAIRRHPSYVVHFHGRSPSEALSQYGIRWRRDAASTAEYDVLYSLARRIGDMAEATDGKVAAGRTSFTQPEVKTGPDAGDAALEADLFADLEPARAYRSLRVVREDKVGGTPVYVLEKTPFAGGPVTDFVAKADGRLLRRISGSGQGRSAREFADFRTADGLTLPFRTTVTNAGGSKTIEVIDQIRFDEYVPEWPWRMGN